MKKMIAVLLVICCLLMTSCSASPTETVAPNGDNALISYGGILAVQHSLDEYTKYLETYQKQIPEDFVHWDNIPNLGTFLLFVPELDSLNRYHYTIEDQKGKELLLEISHFSDSSNNITTENYKLISVTDDMTSMLNAPCKEKSVIVRNGMEYHYSALGKISSLVWYQNDIRFELYGQYGSFEGAFASPDGCFDIYRLFSINETQANAALEEFNQVLNGK